MTPAARLNATPTPSVSCVSSRCATTPSCPTPAANAPRSGSPCPWSNSARGSPGRIWTPAAGTHPPNYGCWLVTAGSSPPCWAPTANRWTSAGPPGSSPPGYAARSPSATMDAPTPAATAHQPGATSTTAPPGKTAATPPCTTASCSAATTTASSTPPAGPCAYAKANPNSSHPNSSTDNNDHEHDHNHNHSPTHSARKSGPADTQRDAESSDYPPVPPGGCPYLDDGGLTGVVGGLLDVGELSTGASFFVSAITTRTARECRHGNHDPHPAQQPRPRRSPGHRRGSLRRVRRVRPPADHRRLQLRRPVRQDPAHLRRSDRDRRLVALPDLHRPRRPDRRLILDLEFRSTPPHRAPAAARARRTSRAAAVTCTSCISPTAR